MILEQVDLEVKMRVDQLKSDFSEKEMKFYTTGKAVVGTGNTLTDMFKTIGMYIELKADKRADEIVNYVPSEDIWFKHENMGYTEIRNRLEKKLNPISRKYIKNISRKWPLSRIVLSYDTHEIIEEIFSYIQEDKYLTEACSKYMTKDISWNALLPIQYDFLGVRIDNHRSNWQKAQDIVDNLLDIKFGE